MESSALDNSLTFADLLELGVKMRQSLVEREEAEVALARAMSASKRSQLRLNAILAQEPYIVHQIDAWKTHVDDFGYTRTKADKMPRAVAWRPYRFAVQDVIFALTAMRHAKEANCIEVDVFLTAEPKYDSPEMVPPNQELFPYEPLAAAKALTLMLLSEAFRCGTTMELRFTTNVERSSEERDAKVTAGRVPHAICALASELGTPPPDPESGVLRREQAVPLYAALTGFQPALRQRVDQLVSDGLLTLERACYLVQHGVWSAPELEGLIAASPYPDLVLDGEIQPESRHLYHHVQVHTRTALLGGVLDRALLTRDPPFQGSIDREIKRPKGRIEGADVTVDPEDKKPGKDVEDDDRDLVIEYDPAIAARVYRLGPRETEPMPLPDWRPHASQGAVSPSGAVSVSERLVALLRPRNEAGMLQYLADDIRIAHEYPRQPGDSVALIVPLDFNDLDGKRQADFLQLAATANVRLMVCPESTKTLDGYAAEKLSRSRVLPE